MTELIINNVLAIFLIAIFFFTGPNSWGRPFFPTLSGKIMFGAAFLLMASYVMLAVWFYHR